MTERSKPQITTLDEFAGLADYSFMDTLNADPQATRDGDDRRPREVLSGHFVPVAPTPLEQPEYLSYSRAFFDQLGLSHTLMLNEAFLRLFAGDLSAARPPLRQVGWATGYALSIYGTEYVQQCPFGTGNGYGDGRALSLCELVIDGRRWEVQLKGAGQTPYCRGGDGRAVLRSSVREFLAQEHMHALGVPTSRSLTLCVSQSETVLRPWYSPGSRAADPDRLVENPVAIATRVAPSFIRVGQLELFARRARAHPAALEELRMLVAHLIDREYRQDIPSQLPWPEQLLALARLFRGRLTALVAHWLRVGYCQGNFNSDNCAAGGFTLDYGPFGFCEMFDMAFQPWTGGGEHFALFNQPLAAEANFHMFWQTLRPLLRDNREALAQLDELRSGFAEVMQQKLASMWAQKLGLSECQPPFWQSLLQLMASSAVDYTVFFRELSQVPDDFATLKKAFYTAVSPAQQQQWQAWFSDWRALLANTHNAHEAATRMQQVNPKYTWREWLVVPAYEQAAAGDYSLVEELQQVLSQPYEEQSEQVADKYYRLKPKAFFNAGGVSHYSCSS